MSRFSEDLDTDWGVTRTDVLPPFPWLQLHWAKKKVARCQTWVKNDEDNLEGHSWPRRLATDGAAIQICPAYFDWVNLRLSSIACKLEADSTSTQVYLVDRLEVWKSILIMPSH